MRNNRQKNRFLFIRSFVVLLFVILACRLIFVQGILRAELNKKAQKQGLHETNATITRHMILDRNGLPLAETVQVYSCFADPTKIENIAAVTRDLSHILGLDQAVLENRILSTKGAFLWIKRNIPASLAARVKAVKLKGVGFKLEQRRHYPLGPIASHLLGLVGIDGKGLSGIEQKYESSLSKLDPPVAAPFPKGNVQLTIDGWVQQIVERELDYAAKKIKAKKGMVVIQEPHSGRLLAMATWPPLSLDPDHPPNSHELLIPLVSDVFEPGSTYKIVVAAAALEEGLIRNDDVFFLENGAWNVADIVINDHKPLSNLTFDDIFVYSSNIGSAKIAERVGSERLYQYSRLFGFGVYPGSGLAGETKGMLRHPSRWSGISKHVLSFGQEVGVTSLQMVGAYSAVANGGLLMEPQVVQSIVSDEKDLVWENNTAIVRRVISKGTALRLNKILTEVVSRGTGQNAQVRWKKDYPVAGKTGTAQKFDREKKRYDDSLTLVSFAGFFPADNPKLAMYVMLDEPEGRRWGGTDAAPLFRRIAEQLTTHLFL